MIQIKVVYNDGEITRDPRSKEWKFSTGLDENIIRMAKEIMQSFRNSPAYGYPGCYLAQLIAERTGGRAEITGEPPEAPEGAVY